MAIAFLRSSSTRIGTIVITSFVLWGLPQAGSTTTLQITSGQFSAGSTGDFQANGSVSGPDGSIFVSGNAVSCGPCATLVAPVLPRFGTANLSTRMDFFPSGRPGSERDFDGTLHVSAETVVVTDGNATSPFTLSGTLAFLTGGTPVGKFDVIGSGIETVTDMGTGISLSFQPVPEPSTWLLLATGLTALLLSRTQLRS